jgi:hypothetical protein
MNLETSTTQQLNTRPLASRRSLLRRALYRFRQFWLNLSSRPEAAQLEQAQAVLSPQELALFACLQPSEQAHSLHLFQELQRCSQNHPHLLTAALLHDAGKIRYPLALWERVLIVLTKAINPRLAHTWGEEAPPPLGWRKAFVVARQHAAWGAELAAQAGSSAMTVALIRRHQDIHLNDSTDEESQLLTWLQAYDNEN